MQIILNHSEVEDAIRTVVLSQINVKDGQEFSFDFDTSGDEVVVYVGIGAPEENTTKRGPKPKKRGRAPRAVDVADVSEEDEDPTEEVKEKTSDAKAETEQDAKAAAEKEPEQEAETKADEPSKKEDDKPVAATNESQKIFSSKESSSVPLDPSASNDAKPATSLFANLTRPGAKA